jgi:SAM-dependent methyltransferase
MTRAADWSGRVGGTWAAEWRRTDRSFADLSRPLDAAILAAAPQTGVVLDIGCGAGATSIALATARPALEVVGVDVGADLVTTAQARAADLTNLDFRVADLNDAIGDLPSPDLIFSRHGVMFFDDPVEVFTRLRTLARPDAALVFSCFRAASLNPWASDLVAAVTGASMVSKPGYVPGPFGFADDAFVIDLLMQAGWRAPTAEAVDYRYVAGVGDDPFGDAIDFLRRIGPIAAALREAPQTEQAAMLDRLARELDNNRVDGEVVFPAAAWIWRARAGLGTA